MVHHLVWKKGTEFEFPKLIDSRQLDIYVQFLIFSERI